MKPYRHGRNLLVVPALGILALCLASPVLRAQPNTFQETDLVSDIPLRAATTDASLMNPWGIAFSPTSPFWISDNKTGLSTLYTGAGTKLGLEVTIPPPLGASPPAAPTGVVFNGGSAFHADRFVFASEDGTISGWRGALGTSAELLVDNSAAGAVYKGLALGSMSSNTYLYASDFHNNRIDVFPSLGAPALSGTFSDPTIPAGYAPFNVQNIGGQLYVTYALQDAGAHDDVAGAGHGFVDVFDLNGNLVKRLVTGGVLDSPWGLARAPAGFGPFSGDLLVGNFGDGMINAFDPSTGNFIDALRDPASNPLTIEGLWGIDFGNGANGFLTNTLYFTAGIPGDGAVEDHGLFGSVKAVPDTGMTLFMLAGAFLGLLGLRRHWQTTDGVRV